MTEEKKDVLQRIDALSEQLVNLQRNLQDLRAVVTDTNTNVGRQSEVAGYPENTNDETAVSDTIGIDPDAPIPADTGLLSRYEYSIHRASIRNAQTWRESYWQQQQREKRERDSNARRRRDWKKRRRRNDAQPSR
jgi:hypothetical protein